MTMTITPTSTPARRARGTWSRVAAVAAVVACGAGCSGPQDPHGSPILTQVYWVAGGAQLLAWARDSSPIASSVPPFGSEVDFVFDRRLDGDRIEMTVTTGGVTTTQSLPNPPITATWPGMAQLTGDAAFAMTVQYNSEPRFGGATSYVYAQPRIPGFPSSLTVTFDLDLSRLTSAYDEPASAPTQIPIVTAPLSVALSSPTEGVPVSYTLPLAFSNRLPALPADGTSPFVHVTRDGVPVPYRLLPGASPSLSASWYLTPADCLGVWPANATLEVTVDAGLLDVFGGKLAQGATTSFVTGAGASAADASCAVAPPADGGAPDAAADGGVGDAASGDLSGDVPGDAGLGAPDAGATDGGVTDAAGAPPASDASDVAVAEVPDAAADAAVD